MARNRGVSAWLGVWIGVSAIGLHYEAVNAECSNSAWDGPTPCGTATPSCNRAGPCIRDNSTFSHYGAMSCNVYHPHYDCRHPGSTYPTWCTKSCICTEYDNGSTTPWCKNSFCVISDSTFFADAPPCPVEEG